MFVIVHTITMTVGDLELCADFYHSITLPSSNQIKMFLLGKQFAVKRLNKGFCVRDTFNYYQHSQPNLKHRLRAIKMKQVSSAPRRYTSLIKKLVYLHFSLLTLTGLM